MIFVVALMRTWRFLDRIRKNSKTRLLGIQEISREFQEEEFLREMWYLVHELVGFVEDEDFEVRAQAPEGLAVAQLGVLQVVEQTACHTGKLNKTHTH